MYRRIARFCNNLILTRFNRPVNQFALHILPHMDKGWSTREIAEFKQEKLYSEGEIRRFETFATMELSNIYEACNTCINAAAMSASAYHMALDYLNPLNSQDIAYA
jgi:hypothetical protein